MFVIAIVLGIVSLFIMFFKRNKRLDSVEEKLDKLLSEKEK
ncbi:hypothetical protein [Virgibacillus sp. JSM 102003]